MACAWVYLVLVFRQGYGFSRVGLEWRGNETQGYRGGGGRPSGFALSISVSSRGNFNRRFHEAICSWASQISRHFFLNQPQELLEESQLPGLSGPILKNKMPPPPKVTQGRKLSVVWKSMMGPSSWVIPEPLPTWALSSTHCVPQRLKLEDDFLNLSSSSPYQPCGLR